MSPLLIGVLLSATPAGEAGEDPPPGVFHLTEDDGAWALRTPAGEPFLMRGVNHYGDGSGMPWNLAGRYGDRAAWRRSVRDRHREWGFNYLPPSVGPTALNPATVAGPRTAGNLITRTPEWPPERFAELEFPFTIMLAYPRQYMSGPGLPDVFSAEFEEGLNEVCARVCRPLADNPHLIGYHLSHNPPWHPRAASFDRWIDDITGPDTAGRRAWVRLMRRVYGTLDRWRAVYGIPVKSWAEIETLDDPLNGYIDARKHLRDREAFMARVCEKWYAAHHAAIRRHDPHHLILGDRNTLHLQPLPAYAIRTMKPHVDVLSVNAMGPKAVQLGLLEDVTRHWDGPILIADGGAGVYHGEPRKSGWASRDLPEYEAVFAGQVELAIDHPQVIGFAWCGFYETPHPGGRGGLVDAATGDPLPERVAVVKEWNACAAAAERDAAAESSRSPEGGTP